VYSPDLLSMIFPSCKSLLPLLPPSPSSWSGRVSHPTTSIDADRAKLDSTLVSICREPSCCPFLIWPYWQAISSSSAPCRGRPLCPTGLLPSHHPISSCPTGLLSPSLTLHRALLPQSRATLSLCLTRPTGLACRLARKR
jgi:hypothetical protein